jgi:hypothetical protein
LTAYGTSHFVPSFFLQSIWTHFLRKLGYGTAGPRAGLPALIAALYAPAAPPTADVSSSGGDGDSGAGGVSVTMDGFRAALHGLGTPITHREVEAIMASCEPEGTADAVSIDMLLEHAAATLTPVRAAIVDAVFDRAAGAASTVPVAALAARFRPESSTQGAESAGVLEAFLGMFIELGCDGAVPRTAFAAYVASVSASIDTDAGFAGLMAAEWP